MAGYIRSEWIKNKAWYYGCLSILLPVILGLFVRTRIVDRAADYIDIPLDAYTFVIISNIYLPLIFPFFVLLISIFFVQNESRDNGWVLVLSTVKKPEKVIAAKCFVNLLLILVSYGSYTCVNCFLLRDRGAEILFSAVIVPMLYSFICFIPVAIAFQIINIILPHMVEKVFLGIFFILLNFIVTQTKYNQFYLPGFYYTITQDFSYAYIKVPVCILAGAGVLYFGAKLVKKWIQLFDV